jgi:hypothetical protein
MHKIEIEITFLLNVARSRRKRKIKNEKSIEKRNESNKTSLLAVEICCPREIRKIVR